MGTDEESATTASTNLKVPPLKIVLSSHQNNTIITNSSLDETESSEQSSFNSHETNDNSDDHIVDRKEVHCENDLVDKNEKSIQKKDSKESESYQICGTSSSTSSERSNSTTPSSDPESVASNSTIISDQQAKNKNEDIKQDKNHKSVAKQANTNIKKTDGNLEQSSENTNINSTKEQQNSNANQRITRSSQRAAQQSRTENQIDSNSEEITLENQDKSHESARKAKRKKGEVQEVVEQDNVTNTEQTTINFADIYPADYQLPAQNSFELYRDIRRRSHKKLSKLDSIRPVIPYGFKDYLINGGPYLLDGNKLGVGVNGARLRNLHKNDQKKNGMNVTSLNCFPRKKLTNLHHKWHMHPSSQQRHNSYVIPKLLDAPKNLQVNSPLYELFLDQEKTRHQMKIQHLKERERSILTAEQEILRAYNKAAIAGVRQKLHLSACTYFYYQERYHYIDDKKDKKSIESLDPNETSKKVDDATDSKTPAIDPFLCGEKEEGPAEKDKDIDKDEVIDKDEESNDAFLAQLQEIDDKWAKIMKDMLIRHKNEADSLYAVQTLEWEWKAKEIGSCDVRFSLKIESEMVPRIEIVPLDY